MGGKYIQCPGVIRFYNEKNLHRGTSYDFIPPDGLALLLKYLFSLFQPLGPFVIDFLPGHIFLCIEDSYVPHFRPPILIVS